MAWCLYVNKEGTPPPPLITAMLFSTISVDSPARKGRISHFCTRCQHSPCADMFCNQIIVASVCKNRRQINALLSSPLVWTDIYLKPQVATLSRAMSYVMIRVILADLFLFWRSRAAHVCLLFQNKRLKRLLRVCHAELHPGSLSAHCAPDTFPLFLNYINYEFTFKARQLCSNFCKLMISRSVSVPGPPWLISGCSLHLVRCHLVCVSPFVLGKLKSI